MLDYQDFMRHLKLLCAIVHGIIVFWHFWARKNVNPRVIIACLRCWVSDLSTILNEMGNCSQFALKVDNCVKVEALDHF